MQVLLKSLLTRLAIGSYLGNILLLAGGTGVSQLIVIAATPVLTRIYNPADFGILTVFVSILSLMSSLSALRYEIAIPLPDDESDAFCLVILGLLVLGITTTVIYLASIFFGEELFTLLSVPQLVPYGWSLPLSFFVFGANQIFIYWHIRQKLFAQLTQNQILQSFLMVSIQLLIGLLVGQAIGLLGGYLLSLILVTIILALQVLRGKETNSLYLSRSGIWNVGLRYRKFPMISSWSGLMNNAGLQLQPLLFSAFYGLEIAGWIGLAQRIGAIPVSLIGRSVSQVYFGEAARLKNENLLAMKSLLLRTASKVFLFVGIPMIVVGLTAPWVFAFVFGNQWKASGYYVIVLLPVFLGQLVVSPLSQSLNILERQDIHFYWDFARVLVAISTISISRSIFRFEPIIVLGVYSSCMFIMYLLLFYLIWQQAEHALSSAKSNPKSL